MEGLFQKFEYFRRRNLYDGPNYFENCSDFLFYITSESELKLLVAA